MFWSLVFRMEGYFGQPLSDAILFKFKSVITVVPPRRYAKVDCGCHLKGTVNPIAYGILRLSQLRGWDFCPTPQKTMLKLFD